MPKKPIKQIIHRMVIRNKIIHKNKKKVKTNSIEDENGFKFRDYKSKSDGARPEDYIDEY